jgi:hypothetical protein
MGITISFVSLKLCESDAATVDASGVGQKRKSNDIALVNQKKRTMDLVISEEIGKKILFFLGDEDILSLSGTSKGFHHCSLIVSPVKQKMTSYLESLKKALKGLEDKKIIDSKWSAFKAIVYKSLWYKTNCFVFGEEPDQEDYPLVLYDFPPSPLHNEISFSIDEPNLPVRTLVTINYDDYLMFNAKYPGSFDNRFINYIRQYSKHITFFNGEMDSTKLKLVKFFDSGLQNSEQFMSGHRDCEEGFATYKALERKCCKQSVLENLVKKDKIKNDSLDGGICMSYGPDFYDKYATWLPRMITESSYGFQKLFLDQICDLYGMTNRSVIQFMTGGYKQELAKSNWMEELGNGRVVYPIHSDNGNPENESIDESEIELEEDLNEIEPDEAHNLYNGNPTSELDDSSSEEDLY